jgi:tetratricopeptide (TPR) repeat protein
MMGRPGAAAMDPHPLIPRVGGFLDFARLAVLGVCVLGVLWTLDPASSDLLAPKELCFAVALGLLPALGAMRLWWDAPLHFPPKSVLAALAAFCAAVTLSYLASPLRAQAQQSWQVWLLAALLYAAAVDLLVEPAGRRRFLRSLIVGAGLAGARSVAQRAGLDHSAAGLEEAAAFGHRIAGCFGNPNFAGGFFALALPVLVHQAWAAEGRAWRVAARCSAVAASLGLALSAGKAAVFGLFVSAALAGHLLYWSDAASAARRRALAWLACAMAGALIVGTLSLPGDSLRRLAGGPGAWAGSVDFREITWAGTWDLARARPLTGWGPGTFSAAYPGFRRPEAMAAQEQHSYEVTDPENWPLHLLAEVGLLGLVAAVVLLKAVLMPLRRKARAWDRDPGGAGLCLALLCGVAACLACNLASLDLFLPSTLLPLLLLLALGTAVTADRAPSIALNPGNTARVLVSLGLAFMAGVPVVQALLDGQAARLLAQGQALSQSERFNEAVPVYQLALQFDPGLLEARYFLGSSLLDAGGDTNLAQAGEAFAALRSYAPDYVQVHAKLGRLYTAQGRVDEAALEYQKQLKLDPWDLETVQALASLDAHNGRLADAAAVLEDAARRWPGDADVARNLAAVETALTRKKGRP